jgi:hypothetical protein
MVECHREMGAAREERQRAARKVSKLAQTSIARLEGVRAARDREEEMRQRRVQKGLERTVMKDFWGSMARLKKYYASLETKRAEKEVLATKLEHMIERQIELSTKINSILAAEPE